MGADSRGTVVTVTSSTGPPDAAGSRPIAVSMRSRGSFSRSVELSERTGLTRFVSTVRFQPNGWRCAVAYSESALKSAASTSAIVPIEHHPAGRHRPGAGGRVVAEGAGAWVGSDMAQNWK